MQPPKWPGIGHPVGTTPFAMFYAGPQGPASNDGEEVKPVIEQPVQQPAATEQRPTLRVIK